MPLIYHSAMLGEEAAPNITRCRFPSGEAFQWDILNGFPPEFDKCDVFYAEPPWRAGFDKFNERAGVTGRTYAGLVEAMNQAIEKAGKPSFIVSGLHARKLYRGYTGLMPITLRDAPVLLYSWNYDMPVFPEVPSSVRFLEYLAKRFECVGDWCCGYGGTGEVMRLSGKKSVLCDYNAACIGKVMERFNGTE